MINYVEANAAKCGIPPQIGEQLKTGHKNTEAMQEKVCAVAQQRQTADRLAPASAKCWVLRRRSPRRTPVKKGGSTFDTLNGNVLTR